VFAIVVTEYGIKFSHVVDSVTDAFGWVNVFSVFKATCKVRWFPPV
jgi:hypothetical protein